LCGFRFRALHLATSQPPDLLGMGAGKSKSNRVSPDEPPPPKPACDDSTGPCPSSPTLAATAPPSAGDHAPCNESAPQHTNSNAPHEKSQCEETRAFHSLDAQSSVSVEATHGAHHLEVAAASRERAADAEHEATVHEATVHEATVHDDPFDSTRIARADDSLAETWAQDISQIPELATTFVSTAGSEPSKQEDPGPLNEHSDSAASAPTVEIQDRSLDVSQIPELETVFCSTDCGTEADPERQATGDVEVLANPTVPAAVTTPMEHGSATRNDSDTVPSPGRNARPSEDQEHERDPDRTIDVSQSFDFDEPSEHLTNHVPEKEEEVMATDVVPDSKWGRGNAKLAIGGREHDGRLAELTCTSCGFDVLRFSGCKWSSRADYMHFRNFNGHSLNLEKLRGRLVVSPDHAAYACQCAWQSVKSLKELDQWGSDPSPEGGAANGTLRWSRKKRKFPGQQQPQNGALSSASA